MTSTMTATRGARANQSDSLPADAAPIEFVGNEAFETLDEQELLLLPAGTKLYADRDDEASAVVTTVGNFETLHSLPLLSAAGEAFLFRKFNYLKYRAARHAADKSESAAASAEDDRACLLADAEGVRNHIAECNLRLVMSIARKFATNQNEFDDLVIEGNMILLKAIDKFDFARGFRFSTYATHSVQRHFYRWSKRKLRRRALEVSWSPELMGDLAAADAVQDTDESLAVAERNFGELIARLDECLDEREQFIIRERFGIGGEGVARTLRDIAADVSLSKERVRQIQIKALAKLRDFLGQIQPDFMPS